MKITTWITVNKKTVAEIKKAVRLELNTPGRGLLQIAADDQPLAGQHVQINMQLGDNPVQVVFQGIVEEVVPQQARAYRLLVREFSALLNRRIAVSLQHCTPEQILSEISEQTGLMFILPDSQWTKNDVARFQHVGGGYGALDYLLRVFQVPQPIWQQQPDGRIYVGELGKSIMANKVIPIKPELISNLSSQGGDLPAMPRLRPGVKIDLGSEQRFITSIDINDNLMRLMWSRSMADIKMQGIQ